MPINRPFRWLGAIRAWLRRTFGAATRRRAPLILEATYTDHTSLYRIACEAPGVVVTWRCVHHDARNDLLFTLVSVARLHEDLGRLNEYRGNRHDRAAAHPHAWEHAFIAELKTFLKSADGRDIDATYLFMVSWVGKTAIRRRDAQGRNYYGTRVECVGIWACSLGAWDDAPAKRITGHIAQRLAKLERSPLNSWEELVRAIDWLSWLDFYGKKVFGEQHVLQPLKPSRAAETNQTW